MVPTTTPTTTNCNIEPKKGKTGESENSEIKCCSAEKNNNYTNTNKENDCNTKREIQS